MYSHIIRSDEYKRRLIDFIRLEYGIDLFVITPAKRGFYGETWKVNAADHCYFVKIDYSDAHKGIYERSFPIMEHLQSHSIDFISRIVKTSDGRLSTRYDGAVLGVFDWIDGENIETDETKMPEYQMLAKIYTVPADDISIPREDFSGNSPDKFFSLWDALGDAETCSLFENNCAKLERRAERLRHFAAICRDDNTGFVITHGDAGGNLIVSGDKNYIVDWDDPILAPPERDAWNMLCYEGKLGWAKCIFQKALRENGTDYTLRPERLAYYCYYYYFFYLTEFLDCLDRVGIKEALHEYFNSDYWVENRTSYADNHF